MVRSATLWDLKEIRVLIQLSNGTMSQQTFKAMFYLLINGQKAMDSPPLNIFLKVCAHKNHEKLERLNY